MLPPKLPAEPVHLFTVEWWEMDWLGDHYAFTPCKAVYHVFTRWEDYEPKHAVRGADLSHDWMLYRRDFCEGRCPGWPRLSEDSSFWKERYASRNEARLAALERSRERQTRLVRELEAVTKSITDLEREGG